MKNGLSFSQIVASFVSTSVGCRYFGSKLSPHFDAMSLVAQTPWKASLRATGGEVVNEGKSLQAKVRTYYRIYSTGHELTGAKDGRNGYCSIPARMVYITSQ